MENEDTLAVQSLLSRDHPSCGGGGGAVGGGGGGSTWERGEKKENDCERDKEKGVNRVSDQGLVPLDVAALTHNSPLLHVLTKAGARHNPVCMSVDEKYEKVMKKNTTFVCDDVLSHLSVCRPAEWALKLDGLVALASKRVEERKTEVARKAGAGPQAQADVQRQLRVWRLRLQLYCRMRENFVNTGRERGSDSAVRDSSQHPCLGFTHFQTGLFRLIQNSTHCFTEVKNAHVEHLQGSGVSPCLSIGDVLIDDEKSNQKLLFFFWVDSLNSIMWGKCLFYQQQGTVKVNTPTQGSSLIRGLHIKIRRTSERWI